MPYAHCGCECQSERASAWRENAFLELCLEQNGESYGRDSEAKWKNEQSRGRPKVDQRDQQIQGRDEQTTYPRVRVTNENWALNPVNWQGKNDFAVQLLRSDKEIAISWRKFSILNNESRTT